MRGVGLRRGPEGERGAAASHDSTVTLSSFFLLLIKKTPLLCIMIQIIYKIYCSSHFALSARPSFSSLARHD